MSEEIKINFSEMKKVINFTKDILKNKRAFFVLTLFILLAIVIFGSWIRTANIPQLKDVTTGEYTLGPDLDPFLYLRVAHEIVDYGHILNPDNMRYHGTKPYYNFLPYGIAYLYKILSVFNSETSVEYAAIIFPVIFFGFSIIVFFLLIRKIFSNKSDLQKNTVALIASALYSVTPLMQHRTTAGIPELESAGLFFFWLSFLLFLYVWEEKSNGQKFYLNKKYLFALLAGISTCFMIFTWGGFRFIFMSLSISVLIAFMLGKVKKQETLVYILWFLPSISFFLFFYKGGLFDLTVSVPSMFVLIVLLINNFMTQNVEEKIRKITKQRRMTKEIISVLVAVLFGLLILLIIKPSFVLNLLASIKDSLVHPYGTERVGLTVAENAQPYVITWISSFGKGFFWMFFFGTIFLFSNTISSLTKRERNILNLFFIIFITGFIFSRYSPSSILNGENFISQIIYFGSLVLLFLSSAYVYFKRSRENALKDINIDFSHIFLLSLTVLMIIASRGAIRLLVISSPVFIIPVALLPVLLFEYRSKTKDDLLKLFLILILVVSLFFLATTFMNYQNITAQSVKASIPSGYSMQWQYAMAWVRESTPVNSIFVHWWDYGYWIQTLGKRSTVTDGGHAISYWDHLIGRYLLTSSKPEAALSLMKSHNVSYLLIDSTDLGKYSAYSSIGSDDSGQDRFSQIPVMAFDSAQSQINNETETRIYQGGTYVDEDIIYDFNGSQIFLPQNKAVLGAVMIEIAKQGGSVSFKQPKGIFIYNGQQISLPLRYIYVNNQLIDFKNGVESVIKTIPKITQGNGVQIDSIGAAIYLSPKVKNGLFAQLYLLNDAFGNYPTVELAYSQPDSVISGLNSQGANLGEFADFGGFRGPIKIWEVSYPSNIIDRDEFLKISGGYAEFDNLTFTK